MAVLCRMLNKILFSKLFCPSNNIILCIVPLLDCYKLSLFQLIFENLVQPLPWQIQGRGPGAHPPPLIFRPKWDPKGRTNFFWDRVPLISGSGWPGPPLIWRSGSATAYYQMVFLEWHSSSLKNQVFQTVIQESNFPIFFFAILRYFLV